MDPESQEPKRESWIWRNLVPSFLKGAEEGEEENEGDTIARLAEQHLGGSELASLLEKEILSRKIPEDPDETLAWLHDLHASLYPAHWPAHLVGPPPDFKNVLVRSWEGEVLLGCTDETRTPLTFECASIWPLSFEVLSTREINPLLAKDDEAFLLYLEDQRFGLAVFSCHRKRNSSAWQTETLQIESQEVFQYVNGAGYLRLARTEAAGFYSGNVSEEWLREQVVTAGEKFVLIRRTPAMEVALNSCAIIGFQTAGRFIRLTNDFWEAFCKSVPTQLRYKTPADFHVKLEPLNMAKGEGIRYFKANVRIVYIVRSWK